MITLKQAVRHVASQMKTNTLRMVAVAVTAVALATPLAAPAARADGLATTVDLRDPGQVRKLSLIISRSRTIRLTRPYGHALIADAQYADVEPLTDRSLYIIGKRIGTTRLTVLDNEQRLIGIIELETSYDVPGLRAELARSVPGSRSTSARRTAG